MLLFEIKKPFMDTRSYINSRWLGFTGSSIKQSFGQAPTVLWWWDPSEAVFLYFSCYDTCYISSLWNWKVYGKGGAVGFVCLKLAHSEGQTRNVFNTFSTLLVLVLVLISTQSSYNCLFQMCGIVKLLIMIHYDSFSNNSVLVDTFIKFIIP